MGAHENTAKQHSALALLCTFFAYDLAPPLGDSRKYPVPLYRRPLPSSPAPDLAHKRGWCACGRKPAKTENEIFTPRNTRGECAGYYLLKGRWGSWVDPCFPRCYSKAKVNERVNEVTTWNCTWNRERVMRGQNRALLRNACVLCAKPMSIIEVCLLACIAGGAGCERLFCAHTTLFV